jgi:hypothetical protein
LAVVDRGYRGHGVETTKVLISGHKTWHHPAPGKAPQATKRYRAGDRAHEKRRLRGQISAEGRIGDAIFAVLCACGHNVWRIFAHLRALWALFPSLMPAWLRPQNAPSTRSIGRLIRLFNADRASDQEANQEHQGRNYSRMLRANVLHYLPRPALLPLCLL